MAVSTDMRCRSQVVPLKGATQKVRNEWHILSFRGCCSQTHQKHNPVIKRRKCKYARKIIGFWFITSQGSSFQVILFSNKANLTQFSIIYGTPDEPHVQRFTKFDKCDSPSQSVIQSGRCRNFFFFEWLTLYRRPSKIFNFPR